MTDDQIIEAAIQGHASTREAIRWAIGQVREQSNTHQSPSVSEPNTHKPDAVVRQLVGAAEQMCYWARSQAKAQSKGGHETFDLMVLQEKCDALEAALAAKSEQQSPKQQEAVMTDRELLELAAKAAGIDLKPMQISNVREQGDDRFVGYMVDPEQWSRGWFNPLTDDGDALRLAVKLGLTVTPNYHVEQTSIGVIAFTEIEDTADYCAPTRRAIVCAAAEVGKQMGG